MSRECAWCKRNLSNQRVLNQSQNYQTCKCGLHFCSIVCYNKVKDIHTMNCIKLLEPPIEFPYIIPEVSLCIEEAQLCVPLDSNPFFTFMRCPICTEVPAAGQLKEHQACDTTFCRTCFKILRAQSRPTCFNCRESLKDTNTRQLNRHLRAMHTQQDMRCRYYPRCEEPCTLGSVAEHERRCDFSKLTCPICEKDVERQHYLDHVNEVCCRETTPCTYCNKRLLHQDMASHTKKCPALETPCEYCSVSYRSELLSMHQEAQCPKYPAHLRMSSSPDSHRNKYSSKR